MSLMNHIAGRKCLLEIASIMDSLSIPFFLMQGTALGAYRDGGFVPTERDIDIGVLQENFRFDVVMELLDELLENNFDVECFQMPFTRPKTVVAFKSYDIGGVTEVVKTDIVGMARWHDIVNDWRFTTSPVRMYNQHEQYALVHSAEMIEKQRGIRLFGRDFMIPRDIEEYLRREYGDDWRIPTDDHVSRTRCYNFLTVKGIPNDYLEKL